MQCRCVVQSQLHLIIFRLKSLFFVKVHTKPKLCRPAYSATIVNFRSILCVKRECMMGACTCNFICFVSSYFKVISLFCTAHP